MADNSVISDAPSVDSSHISPLERRDSLEKHLQTRPDEQDLKNRHILLDTTAAPSVNSIHPPKLPPLSFDEHNTESKNRCS